jgi:hypothetical protein
MRKGALELTLGAVVTVVPWQCPEGRHLLCPLTILATWFPEMGHGLCAVLLGGAFVEMRLFAGGSGYADCFKYRSKVGIDVAVEALRDFSRRHRPYLPPAASRTNAAVSCFSALCADGRMYIMWPPS